MVVTVSSFYNKRSKAKASYLLYRHLNSFIKPKLIELAITLHPKF